MHFLLRVYLIGEHEVYVDQITEFECVEDDEE